MPEPWRTLLVIFNPMPLLWYALGYLQARRTTAKRTASEAAGRG